MSSSGAVSLSGAFSVAGNNISAVNSLGFRNRIINGDMRIDQRNAGASVTPSNGGQYVLDRWYYSASQVSKLTIQQNYGSATPPAGFTNYLGIKVAATATVGSTDYFETYQRIEGFNVSDLGWGTANAQNVTLSFSVYASTTGTFGGALRNSADNRSYPFSYSISTANTWERKTITIAGDTSGTWLTTNGTGVLLTFSIGTGSTYLGAAGAWASTVYGGATGQTSLMGSTSNYFYITGVQLEAGSVASPFDRRDYGRELIMCQRYYQKLTISIGEQYAAFAGNIPASTRISFPVTMRTTPTVVLTNVSASTTNSAFANFISVDGFSYQVNITATGTYSRQDIASMNGAEL
jgi:hypothetical protein